MVRMGELASSATSGDVLVSLGLGSCIGLALIDRRAAVAGLAHVVLPAAEGRAGEPGKFADTAVPTLLDAVVGLGARRTRVEAVLVGGASMFSFEGHGLEVGQRNDTAVRDELKRLRIPVAAVGHRRVARAHRARRRRRRPRDGPRRRRRRGRALSRRRSRRWRHERPGPLARRHRRPRRGREGGAPARGVQRRPRPVIAGCGRSTSRARRSSRPTRSGASSAPWRRSAARRRRACRPSCACRSSSRSSTSASSRGATRTPRCRRARSPA